MPNETKVDYNRHASSMSRLLLRCGCLREPVCKSLLYTLFKKSPGSEKPIFCTRTLHMRCFFAHCARKLCSGVLCSHWALEITASACFEATSRSKSLRPSVGALIFPMGRGRRSMATQWPHSGHTVATQWPHSGHW
jgi:hypothetical protein